MTKLPSSPFAESLSEITAEDSAESSMTYGASLFIKAANQDVLPSPAWAPSVLGISRLSSWGGFLGKETCHHFEDSRAFEVSKQEAQERILL